MHLDILVRVAQQERERDAARSRLASLAACHRVCCHPNLLDRIVTRMGRNDCAEGDR